MEIVTIAPSEIKANDAARRSFLQLDKHTIAFFLDVDGTLIDIAASPSEVDVPQNSEGSLARLYELTGGALALISGRSISDLDMLFAPLALPIAGGHGAEFRVAKGDEVSRVADLPENLRQALISGAPRGSGLDSKTKGIRSLCTIASRRARKPH